MGAGGGGGFRWSHELFGNFSSSREKDGVQNSLGAKFGGSPFSFLI